MTLENHTQSESMIRAILAVLRCLGASVCTGFTSGTASFVDPSVLVPFAGPFVGDPFAGFSKGASAKVAWFVLVAPSPASATALSFSAVEGSSICVGSFTEELIPMIARLRFEK